MNSTMIILVVIIVVIIAIAIPTSMKKKREQSKKAMISAHHNKDEVWKSIKQYMKDTNQYGCEIIDSYVAKRNSIDYINPNLPKVSRDNIKYANKIREFQYQQAKKDAKSSNSNVRFTRPPIKDIYVICFCIRNIKTKQINPPQAIECEVIIKKIDRKTQDRKIIINGKVNYDKEMEWIAPIRNAEITRSSRLTEKQEMKQRKIIEKAQLRERKLREKTNKNEQPN